ncbi:MAG: hypothetical protein WDW36_000898 [Sanguina aurantia]
MGSSILVFQVVAASLAAAAILVSNRPRGWSRQDLVQRRTSRVSGDGVFAIEGITQGTVLGAYPGLTRTQPEMIEKRQRCPASAGFVFQTTDGRFLDPTSDLTGLPSPSPTPSALFWPFPVDVTLAYVNEPPPQKAQLKFDRFGQVYVQEFNTTPLHATSPASTSPDSAPLQHTNRPLGASAPSDMGIGSRSRSSGSRGGATATSAGRSMGASDQLEPIGTNVCVEDGQDAADLLFVASRDIYAGEELFIDYGSAYDRSGYVARS